MRSRLSRRGCTGPWLRPSSSTRTWKRSPPSGTSSAWKPSRRSMSVSASGADGASMSSDSLTEPPCRPFRSSETREILSRSKGRGLGPRRPPRACGDHLSRSLPPRLGKTSRLPIGEGLLDLRGRFGRANDLLGQAVQLGAVLARRGAQQSEGLVHGDAEPPGKHPLRLLDRHPAFEGRLELDGPLEQESGRVGRLPVARCHDRQRAVAEMNLARRIVPVAQPLPDGPKEPDKQRGGLRVGSDEHLVFPVLQDRFAAQAVETCDESDRARLVRREDSDRVGQRALLRWRKTPAATKRSAGDLWRRVYAPASARLIVVSRMESSRGSKMSTSSWR